MPFQSDKRNGRTFDDERSLELVYRPVRDAPTFKILKNGVQVAAFDAHSEGRELSVDEKRQYRGFDRALIWYVSTRHGRIEDPRRPGEDILDEVIVEALTSFQGLFGTAGYRYGKYIHAVVEVKLGGPVDPLHEK